MTYFDEKKTEMSPFTSIKLTEKNSTTFNIIPTSNKLIKYYK